MSIKIKSQLPVFFKILVKNKPCHGGSGKVPAIGKWTEEITDLSPCFSGYHLTTDPLHWWKPFADLWVVEARGKMVFDGNKVCVSSYRKLYKVTPLSPIALSDKRIQCFLAASMRSQDPTIDLQHLEFYASDLSNASLGFADLHDINFWSSNFSNSVLNETNFTGCDLSHTNFTQASLHSSNLQGANCIGSIFSHSVMSNVDLTNTQGLKTCQFFKTYFPSQKIPGWKNIKGYMYLKEKRNLYNANLPTSPKLQLLCKSVGLSEIGKAKSRM